MWLVTTGLLLLNYAGLMVNRNMWLQILLMFVNGLIAGQCAFSYVYAASMLPQTYAGLLSTAYMAVDGLTIAI